jgi:hypothetical protein
LVETQRHLKHFSGRAAVKISTLSKEKKENLCTNSKIPLNATFAIVIVIISLMALVEF